MAAEAVCRELVSDFRVNRAEYREFFEFQGLFRGDSHYFINIINRIRVLIERRPEK